MSSAIERQVARVLEDAALQAPQVGTDLADRSIKAGAKRRQRQRVLTAGSTFVGVAAIIGMVSVVFGGLESTSNRHQPATPGTVSISPSETSPSSNLDLTTTPCSDVQVPPANTPVDTVLFAEEGILQYFYSDRNGRAHSYAIDYENDESCRTNERLAKLIQHALDATG